MAIKILNDLLPIAEQTEVGVVKPDNVSITITETGELQSSVVDLPDDVVTAENYDNPKLWKGTLEEYNAIEIKDPLVTYIITDDNVETLKTTDYNALSNKPSINDVTLEGNKTLEELNIQPADTSLTTSQITNCITKIPQDIKLELANGTLTLKAGSKLYVPNGVGVFDEVVVESDVQLLASLTSGYFTEQYTWCYNPTLNKIQGGITSFQTASGTFNNAEYCMFYDTTDNIIKYTTNTGASWEEGYSLPFVTTQLQNGTGNTSVNQVFNGFGYIGSTVFALPGVEGLIPNGRNNDGSLNNIKCKLNTVLTRTSENWNTYIWSDGNNQIYVSNTRIYDFSKNYIYETNGNIILQFCLGHVKKDSLNILNLKPKYTFNAIDRNDTEWASTASKPSSRYIDLTLGASGSTYTASANGWVVIAKKATAANQYLTIFNDLTLLGYRIYANAADQYLRCSLPIKKNDIFEIGYTADGETSEFRFIYDEGVK